ncbi:prevent-host-death protein [Acetobacterium paludosum]|uniref:Prevent-host-death protein n=1 Tax=Acetobacterium paludosum TaxID=52693 RepID=A0A923I2D9_9FIRM|nr:prevent-host-death protein [Acetobacterium paludosum]MBC3887835.1 prevent-host-death protein [Acetobacterium paludosum]
MPNIKPLTDLKNYAAVLQEITEGEPVFLTEDGRGKYAIIDINEYETLRAAYQLMASIAKGKLSGPEKKSAASDDAEKE